MHAVQVFKTQLWFCRHMQRGKHKKPAVSMKYFVHKRMQLHIAQSKQVTSMHFQKMKVDSDDYCLSHQLCRGTSRQVYRSSKVEPGSQKGKEGFLADQKLQISCMTVSWRRMTNLVKLIAQELLVKARRMCS